MDDEQQPMNNLVMHAEVLRHNFEAAFLKVCDNLQEMSKLWDEDYITDYPSYLPSFDEFIFDFKGMLGYDI